VITVFREREGGRTYRAGTPVPSGVGHHLRYAFLAYMHWDGALLVGDGMVDETERPRMRRFAGK